MQVLHSASRINTLWENAAVKINQSCEERDANLRVKTKIRHGKSSLKFLPRPSPEFGGHPIRILDRAPAMMTRFLLFLLSHFRLVLG